MGLYGYTDTGTSTTATSGSTWTGLYGYKTYDPGAIRKEKVKAKKRPLIETRETVVPWPHPVKKPDLLRDLQQEFDAWAGNQKQELFSA